MANQRNKLFSKARIADLLLFAFLVLTVEHNSFVLGQFENWPMLAWLLATGLDAGIAFAAFVATDKALGRSTRAISAIWLIGLLVVSYGLNVAHYAGKGAGDWKWELAAIFPVSLAFIGALKPGLLKVVMQAVTVQGQTQPIDPGLLSNIMAKLDRLGEQSGNLSETVEGLAGRFVEMEERTNRLETHPRNHAADYAITQPNMQEILPTAQPDHATTQPSMQEILHTAQPESFHLPKLRVARNDNTQGAADGGGSDSAVSVAQLLEEFAPLPVAVAYYADTMQPTTQKLQPTTQSEKEVRKALIVRLRAEGITWSEIAQQLNASVRTVQNWAKGE